MAIKIDLKRPVIEVEIGGLEFEYDYSDKNLKKELAVGKAAIEKVTKLEDETGFDEAKAVLKEAYDLYLGEGAFEKIHELNPSILELGVGLISLRKGIATELKKRGEFKESGQSKAQKYVKNNKK